MKVRHKRSFLFACSILFLMALFLLYFRISPPEGSVLEREIVSACIGDITNDGTPELLAIAGSGEIDTGERHGQFLLVCDASAEKYIEKLGYIPSETIQHRIDLSGIMPMKVQLGDVNGDGLNEVAVCVYKTTKFHPVMAKRPFFFQLVEGNLIPVWLGSRLSRPFDDYILFDINADSLDEIISIEHLESGNRLLAVYGWKGFGFELLTQSEEFAGQLQFDAGTAAQETKTGEVGAAFCTDSGQISLTFRFKDGALFSTATNTGTEDYDEGR